MAFLQQSQKIKLPWNLFLNILKKKGVTMDNVENIDNNYIKKSSIEILEILPMGMVEMKIGHKLARIAESKPYILEKGFVFLITPDVGVTDWEELISCDIPDFGPSKGFTDDPRLVDIGRKVFNGESFDLKPETVIPPVKK
jgi:hypothetical protein